jgi:hypothetical protein
MEARPFGKAYAKIGVAQYQGKRPGERVRVTNGNQQASVVAHQLGNRAHHGRYHRKSVRYCFGDGHAVGFLLRGEDENICPAVTCVKRLDIELADQRHTVLQSQSCKSVANTPRRDGVTREAPRASQSPRQIAEQGKRFEQYLVSLSLVHCAYAEQIDETGPDNWADYFRSIGARLHDDDLTWWDTIFRDERERRATGDDHERCRPERTPFSFFQACVSGRVEAKGRDEGLMHERDHREPCCLARDHVRQRAKRETIHQRDCFVWNVRNQAAGTVEGSFGGAGEARVEFDGIHTPTLPPKSFRNALVIDITAGARVERTGSDERD